MQKIKTYFAGANVFSPTAYTWDNYVRELCRDTCISPLLPCDNDVAAEPKETLAERIYNKNIEMLRMCDIVIADISPFRGVSADAGTIFEVGYATALDKPVILYSNDCYYPYKERVEDYKADMREGFNSYCIDDYKVEDLGLTDNLMLIVPAQHLTLSVEAAIMFARQKYSGGINNVNE